MSGKKVVRARLPAAPAPQNSGPSLADLLAAARHLAAPHRAVFEQIATLRRAITDRREIPAMGPDGAELPQRLDVDWWSGGQFTLLQQKLAQAETTLQSCAPWQRPALAQHLEQVELPTLSRDIEAAVARARTAALMAQGRHNLAERVSGAFEALGFTVESQDFEAGDARRRLLVGASGPSASRITVVVADGTEPFQLQVELHSYDAHMRPEHILNQRLQALVETLRDAGVAIDRITAGEDQPDEALRHPDALVAKAAG